MSDKEKDKCQGMVIGHYQVVKTLGEGSFAKVRLSEHRITNLKVGHFETEDNSGFTWQILYICYYHTIDTG
jgi:hypothetical protein